MAVSIRAILLSGTAALIAAGVAAGLGVGVAVALGKGVGVGLGAVVCGLVWATTEIAIRATKMSAVKMKRNLFIAFLPIIFTDYTDCGEKEKVE